MANQKRVVITGLGLVSPLGNDLESFSQNLLRGKSAAKKISLFDTSQLPTQIAAEADSKGLDFFCPDRKVVFAKHAGKQALLDAFGDLEKMDFYPSQKRGISMGVGLELFSIPDMIEYRQTDSFPETQKIFFLQSPSDISVSLLAKEFKLYHSPLISISACAASTDAVGQAFLKIRTGQAAMILAGGSDSMLNPLGMGGFCKLEAMTKRNEAPEKASRPFDKDRDGFLMGEGAGFLVLEEKESALKRGAKIYAEILGFGNSLDAYGISEPHPEAEGAMLAMQRALKQAELEADKITFISAHGTSTPKNDPIETKALQRVFGNHAQNLWINSTKSMIGHLISASGAVEIIATLACAQKGQLHPTINLDNADPECNLDYIPHQAREIESPFYFIKNSFGFGGQNASLVFRTEG